MSTRYSSHRCLWPSTEGQQDSASRVRNAEHTTRTDATFGCREADHRRRSPLCLSLFASVTEHVRISNRASQRPWLSDVVMLISSSRNSSCAPAWLRLFQYAQSERRHSSTQESP